MYIKKLYKIQIFLTLSSLIVGSFFASKGLVDKISLDFFIAHWKSASINIFTLIMSLFSLGLISIIKKINPLKISLLAILAITLFSNNTWPFIVISWFG